LAPALDTLPTASKAAWTFACTTSTVHIPTKVVASLGFLHAQLGTQDIQLQRTTWHSNVTCMLRHPVLLCRRGMSQHTTAGIHLMTMLFTCHCHTGELRARPGQARLT
jgi:hypothetical protein